MKIREAGHEVGPVYVPFVASRHSRSLKAQTFFRLSKMRQDKEEPHPSEVGCGALVQCIGTMKFACVHCPHFGLRTGSYRARIGPDSACLQGSPVFARAGTRFESHLGHVFSLFRGFLVLFRVDSVHTLASDLMFRVCGVADRPIRLYGGVAGYGGPRTALWDAFWVFILVRPSLGVWRSPVHGG